MLLTQNSKLKKTSIANGARVFNFGIPALKTCIGADKCKAFCYANKGAYIWPVVKSAYERRLTASKADNFPEMMVENAIMKQATHVRIHDAGDFYSREYVAKWLTIADALPHVIFYAYTKSIPLFKGVNLPANFKLIYSYGGKYDAQIDKATDRHSQVFKELIPNGYINASDDDLQAIGTNANIGLILH